MANMTKDKSTKLITSCWRQSQVIKQRIYTNTYNVTLQIWHCQKFKLMHKGYRNHQNVYLIFECIPKYCKSKARDPRNLNLSDQKQW